MGSEYSPLYGGCSGKASVSALRHLSERGVRIGLQVQNAGAVRKVRDRNEREVEGAKGADDFGDLARPANRQLGRIRERIKQGDVGGDALGAAFGVLPEEQPDERLRFGNWDKDHGLRHERSLGATTVSVTWARCAGISLMRVRSTA